MERLPEDRKLQLYASQIYDLCCIRSKRKRLALLRQITILEDYTEDDDEIGEWFLEAQGGKSKYWSKWEKERERK